jgi:hypothetical protein
MTTLRNLAFLLAVALVPGAVVLAQDAAPDEPEDEAAWSYSIYGYAYFVGGDDDYFQPTATADHDWLHLEARHNYEDLDTTSLWGGYNFGVGEKVTFEGTAMAGAVFGSTDGIAPAFKGTLTWSKLTLYGEAEYLFDHHEHADSFFYAWSELYWNVNDWCRLGLVGQRTRVYQTDREIQRGVLVGFAGEHVDFTTYVFNLDERSPTVVVALGVSF